MREIVSLVWRFVLECVRAFTYSRVLSKPILQIRRRNSDRHSFIWIENS